MAPRCFLILMCLVFTAACSPDSSEPETNGLTSEDSQMLDKAATELDDETDPNQTVNSGR